jgi:hypothetical protein
MHRETRIPLLGKCITSFKTLEMVMLKLPIKTFRNWKPKSTESRTMGYLIFQVFRYYDSTRWPILQVFQLTEAQKLKASGQRE